MHLTSLCFKQSNVNFDSLVYLVALGLMKPMQRYTIFNLSAFLIPALLGTSHGYMYIGLQSLCEENNIQHLKQSTLLSTSKSWIKGRM